MVSAEILEFLVNINLRARAILPAASSVACPDRSYEGIIISGLSCCKRGQFNPDLIAEIIAGR